MQLSIPALDLFIIIAYLALMVFIGIYSSRKMRKSASGYFLAGKSLTWPVVGAALFSSNISTIHLVGLSASGYNEGLAWGNFEWMATFTLILLGLVFAPFYFKSKISTIPEFLEKRFDSRSRTFVAFMGILGALFMHIGLSLYAGAVVFKQFFGIDVMISILLISIITGIYTVLGGLKAVVVTESIQTVILVLGAILVTVFAILALPEKGINSLAELTDAVKPGQLSMVHADDSKGLSWYSFLLGYPVLGIWYWCTDQTIVQRVLGAKTIYDAQVGPIFAGLLKTLPVLFIVFPGVLAYVLFSDVIGEDANQALPIMISKLIPTGLMGLISAGLLAALMSSIAAALHSIATLISLDIVKRMRPSLMEKQQITIGRWSAVVVMILAMAWSTQGERYSSIFHAVQTIAACLAPPLAAVFLWGILWRRGTASASFYTLILGFVIGVSVFLLELPITGEKRLLSEVLHIGTLMQAWWGFVICSFIFFTVSLFTPKPDYASIEGLVFERFERSESHRSKWASPNFLSIILILFMILLYTLFW